MLKVVGPTGKRFEKDARLVQDGISGDSCSVGWRRGANVAVEEEDEVAGDPSDAELIDGGIACVPDSR